MWPVIANARPALTTPLKTAWVATIFRARECVEAAC